MQERNARSKHVHKQQTRTTSELAVYELFLVIKVKSMLVGCIEGLHTLRYIKQITCSLVRSSSDVNYQNMHGSTSVEVRDLHA